MRKIIFLFSFLMLYGVAYAQENDSNKPKSRRIESPEGMARSEASKMKRELDLTDKQYDKLYSFFLKEKQAAIKSMQANASRAPQGGPRGGMGRHGGPGNFGGTPPEGDFSGSNGMSGNRPMGGPENNYSKPITPEQMEKQRAKRNKKISKIVGKEKFAQWQEKHSDDFSRDSFVPEKSGGLKE